mgnify:FL=1
MKKTILLIITLFLSFASISQTLLITGDTIKVTQDPCFETSASLSVTNNTNNTLDIHCEKVIIDTSLSTENYFCWGAECYGSSTYLSTSFNTINSGETDTLDFGGYYNAFCSNAPAIVKYCFFPASNSSDRHCVTITYNGTLTNISLLKSNSFSIYPNPSNDFVNIDLISNEIKSLIIFNSYGEKITEKDLITKNNLKVDISDFAFGTYFVVAEKNDMTRSVKRFIVQ